MAEEKHRATPRCFFVLLSVFFTKILWGINMKKYFTKTSLAMALITIGATLSACAGNNSSDLVNHSAKPLSANSTAKEIAQALQGDWMHCVIHDIPDIGFAILGKIKATKESDKWDIAMTPTGFLQYKNNDCTGDVMPETELGAEDKDFLKNINTWKVEFKTITNKEDGLFIQGTRTVESVLVPTKEIVEAYIFLEELLVSKDANKFTISELGTNRIPYKRLEKR